MERKSQAKAAIIASLVLLLMLLPVLSACGTAAPTVGAAEAANQEGEATAASSCVTCHSDEELLKETVALVEEEPEEPSGEG